MTADLIYAFAWSARPGHEPRSGEPDRAVAVEIAHAVRRLLTFHCRSSGTVRSASGGRPPGTGA